MRRLTEDRGAAGVIAAIILPVLALAAVMLIDLYSVSLATGRAQTAADAAALAVAIECAAGDCDDPQAVAQELAGANLPGEAATVSVDPIYDRDIIVRVTIDDPRLFVLTLGGEDAAHVQTYARATWDDDTGARLTE